MGEAEVCDEAAPNTCSPKQGLHHDDIDAGDNRLIDVGVVEGSRSMGKVVAGNLDDTEKTFADAVFPTSDGRLRQVQSWRSPWPKPIRIIWSKPPGLLEPSQNCPQANSKLAKKPHQSETDVGPK